MEGFVGTNSIVSNVINASSAKIYNNCRVVNSKMDKETSIGDFSTVRDSNIGERSTIQRYCDIWRLSIGRYSCVGRLSTIQATTIGSFCALSWNLKIGGDDHDYKMLSTHPFWHDISWGVVDDEAFAKEYHEMEYAPPCTIGNDVWIGAGVTVLRGVNIGDGCVIGGGAIITKDIEPYSIVVGTPGRVIRKRFSDSIINALEEIKWWNWPIDQIRENIDLFRGEHVTEETIRRLYDIGRMETR